MLSSSRNRQGEHELARDTRKPMGRASVYIAIMLSSLITGCTWQPLYGDTAYSSSVVPDPVLSQVYVSDVNTRVGQQVRNHLIFLLQGGKDNASTRYELKMRVRDIDNRYAAVRNVRDFTAGQVTVTASYDLIDKTTMERVAGGSRVATAPYDRTPMDFANSRAQRDAENRAAKEVAEQLRLAIASDLQG
jgi:LPS-assembly lipoprotein